MQQQLDQATQAELARQFVEGTYAQGLWFAITHPGHNEVYAVRAGASVISWDVRGGQAEVTIERGDAKIVFAGSDTSAQSLRFRSLTGTVEDARALVADANTLYNKAHAA